MDSGDPKDGPLATQLSHEEVRNLTRRAKSSFLLLLSTTAIWQIVSWGLTLVTARILTPADYGVFGMIESLLPYLLLLTTLNLENWLVQTSELDEKKQRAVLSLALLFSLATTVIAFIGAPWLAAFYGQPELTLLCRVSAPIFLLRGIQLLPEARLRRELTYKPIASANLVLNISRGILQLVLAYLGFGFWALALGQLFREAAMTIWLTRAGGITRGIRWSGEVALDAIKFGISATGSTVFWLIFVTADTVIVGRFFGVDVLGFYRMASYLTSLPLAKLNTVLSPVLTPYYSRLKSDEAQLNINFLKVVKGTVGLVAPLALGLAVVAKEAVPLVMGEKWAPMLSYFYVMCIVTVIRTITTHNASFLLALNRPKKILLSSAITALSMTSIFYLLASTWGITGIFAAWLIFFPIFGTLVDLWIFQSVSGVSIRTYLQNILSPVVCAVVMVLACVALPLLLPGLAPLSMLIVKIIVGAVVYVGAFRLLFKSDFNQLIGVFPLRQ